jgi:hypothetical protein
VILGILAPEWSIFEAVCGISEKRRSDAGIAAEYVLRSIFRDFTAFSSFIIAFSD